MANVSPQEAARLIAEVNAESRARIARAQNNKAARWGVAHHIQHRIFDAAPDGSDKPEWVHLCAFILGEGRHAYRVGYMSDPYADVKYQHSTFRATIPAEVTYYGPPSRWIALPQNLKVAEGVLLPEERIYIGFDWYSEDATAAEQGLVAQNETDVALVLDRIEYYCRTYVASMREQG